MCHFVWSLFVPRLLYGLREGCGSGLSYQLFYRLTWGTLYFPSPVRSLWHGLVRSGIPHPSYFMSGGYLFMTNYDLFIYYKISVSDFICIV